MGYCDDSEANDFSVNIAAHSSFFNNTALGALIAGTVPLLEMIFRPNRLVFRLFIPLEAGWNAFDDLVQEAFVQESHGIPVSG